jgi:hypothetical protein
LIKYSFCGILLFMLQMDFADFARAVNIDELADISSLELAEYFMPAAIIGLADGDVVGLHTSPVTDPRLARLYGRNDLSQGEVARKVFAAALSNVVEPGPVRDFQTFAAEYLSNPQSPFANNNAPSNIRLRPEGIEIDANPIVLSTPPKVLIEYGACLVSRSFVDDQIGFIEKGHPPFTYTPLTRTHFTNQAILQRYNRLLGPGTSGIAMDKRLFIGREDGVKAATAEIVEKQTQHTGRCDIADVIVCAGTHHSNPEEIKAGITNAAHLLKEAGILVVRSVAKPSGEELGTDQIIDWAYESGFSENGVKFSATYKSIGHFLRTGHATRQMKSVVLTR